MGSYWLCTLPTSQAAVVQGQQPAEGGNSERSWEHMQEERAKRWILKRNPHCFASYMEIKLSMITVEPLGIIVYLLLSAFPVLVRIKEFKRSRKCKVWCWNGKWAAVTTWPSHSISIHFPHLEHFPEKCESEGLFFLSFFLGYQKFYSCQKTWRWVLICWFEISPPHIHIISPILSQWNTILLRNDWRPAACGALKCGGTHHGAEASPFSAECVTLPRLVLFVFFCRQINNSWIFYDCLLALR